MKFLAWDTSSKTGAIIAFESYSESQTQGKENIPFKLIAEFVLNVDSTHSESLLWGIHQVLESARWQLKDVDVFGVGHGPGSFTGLRIGVTTARTLAHSLGKPLVGVSSLAALARPAALAVRELNSPDTLVVAVTDACKGELFALWGKAADIAKATVIDPKATENLNSLEIQERVIEPASLMVELRTFVSKNHSSLKWIAVGEGRGRYLEEWKEGPLQDHEILPHFLSYSNQIQSRYLGQLVWEAYTEGFYGKALELSPQYLRLSNAELKLQASSQKVTQ